MTNAVLIISITTLGRTWAFLLKLFTAVIHFVTLLAFIIVYHFHPCLSEGKARNLPNE
jgi:hypothetical protein